MIRRLHKVLLAVAGRIAGNHPDATIFHLQWLRIRRQIACARYAAQLARGVLVDVGCGKKPYLRFFRERVARYIV